MKKHILIIVSLLSLLLSACQTAHVFSDTQGFTKDQMLQKFGEPTKMESRSDGNETWIYKEAGNKTQTTYYVIKNGVVMKKDIVYGE